MLISQLGWLVQHSVCLSIVCERVVCWRDRQTGIFFLRLRCHKLTWLMDRGEGWEPVTLLSPVLVWHWFALMRFRDEQIRDPVAAIVLSDMLMENAFRQLRMLLRLGYGFLLVSAAQETEGHERDQP